MSEVFLYNGERSGHVPTLALSQPAYRFFIQKLCVREVQTLLALNPPQGVLVRGHAGRVISNLSCSSELVQFGLTTPSQT
jgi:hypothetical protein